MSAEQRCRCTYTANVSFFFIFVILLMKYTWLLNREMEPTKALFGLLEDHLRALNDVTVF